MNPVQNETMTKTIKLNFNGVTETDKLGKKEYTIFHCTEQMTKPSTSDLIIGFEDIFIYADICWLWRSASLRGNCISWL